jgi:hypothetical protein
MGARARERVVAVVPVDAVGQSCDLLIDMHEK